MKATLLILVVLLALPISPRAKTVWPDSLDKREGVMYYIAKIDTTFTPQGADSGKFSIDTTMASRILVTAHYNFDSLYILPSDTVAFKQFLYFFASRLRGGQKAIERQLTAGIRIEPVTTQPKKK